MDPIQVNFPGNKKVDAVIDGQTIHTDQKKKQGGDETAPTPFELFLSSLATCAGIYVLSFCESRKIPTDGLGLRVFCETDPQSKAPKVTTMNFELDLPAGFPDKYKSAVKRAVDACTVKKHLADPPAFAVTLKE